ncbi:hypothetical protein [Actinokineospora sp.]|uniref:hypothetical protein n=1 Tax=Actinokineospora sp. TaxID=1872133 RepID=UPI0040378358
MTVPTESDPSRAHLWVLARLEQVSRPQSPVQQPWGVSLGELLPAAPRVPAVLLGFTRRTLDRFGGLRLAPDGIGINGQQVDWATIEEIRVRNTLDVLLEASSQRLADRIAGLVPWFVPARGYLTSLVVESVFGLVAQVAHRAMAPQPRIPALIPYQIVYKGRFGGRHRVELGIFALLVVTLLPEVNQSIATTASRHRIIAAVEHWTPAHGDVGHRAQELLHRAQTLSRWAPLGKLMRRVRGGRS